MKRLILATLATLLVLGAAPVAFAQTVPPAVLLYPNYRGLIFDDRPEIVVASGSGATVTVRDKVSGATVATATVSGQPARISASTLTQNHPYTVTVVNGGATVGTWTVTPVPASSRAGMNVAFDPKGRLLMSGQPRFALGVYDNGFGYSNDPAYYEQTIFAPGGTRQLGDIKLNMYLNYHYGQASLSSMQALMGVLQNHGIKYLQTTNCFNTGSYTRIPFSADQNDTWPTEFGKHPASAGYYTMDECVDGLIAETKTHHQRLAGLDPGSVTFGVTYANGFDTIDHGKWLDAVDLLGSDPYPLYGVEPAAGFSHFQVADTIAQLANASQGTRPVIGVMQFFQFTTNSRWPTYAEERAHAIMSIVEGAKGLFWWEIGNNGLGKADATTRAQQMANLKSIVNELAALEPALVADDAPGALVGNSTRYADPITGRKAQLQGSIANSWLYSAKRFYQREIDRLNAGDTSLSPMAKGAADIRTRVKIVNGTGYVFAYNYTNKTLPVTFTWQTAPGAVRENKSGKTFAVSGNSWTDSFGPYDSRVYVIGNGGTTPPPPPPGPTPTPTSPTVAFTNPAAGATVSGTATVSVAASGGSGSGYTYRMTVDGTLVYSGTNATFSWNTAAVANGSHALGATVTDSAGATATASRTVTVSNTTTTPPPTPAPTFTAAFQYPAAGATISGNQSIGMKTTAPWGQSKTWVLSVDGKAILTQTNTSTVLWHQLPTSTLTSGAHTLKLAVTYNGATATATLPVTVAGGTTPAPTPTPLSLSMTSPAAGATVSGTTTIAMAASGGTGTGYSYRMSVDGAQIWAGTTPSYGWNTTTATNGSHTITCTVTDSAGATATTSRTVTVSNTSTTPTASFTAKVTSPAAGATVRGTLSVGSSTTAPWGKSKTFTVVLDGKVVKTYTSTGTTYWYYVDSRTLGNGTHSVQVRVTYGGQTASSAAVSFTVGN